MIKWLLLIAVGIGLFFTLPEVYSKYTIWDAQDASDDDSIVNKLLEPLTPGISPYVLYNDYGLQTGLVVIDVRSQKEFDEHSLPGAVLIPQEELYEKMPKAYPRKEAKVYVYDDSGNSGALSARLLRVMGYDQAFYLQGGLGAWKKNGYQVNSLFMFPE